VGQVEIACDESGYEGEKLIGTTTDVFAHASVRMPVAEKAVGLLVPGERAGGMAPRLYRQGPIWGQARSWAAIVPG
jgi:hypothetical protein